MASTASAARSRSGPNSVSAGIGPLDRARRVRLRDGGTIVSMSCAARCPALAAMGIQAGDEDARPGDAEAPLEIPHPGSGRVAEGAPWS